MNTLWNGFKEWLSQAYLEHPLYTITFGITCGLVGAIIF